MVLIVALDRALAWVPWLVATVAVSLRLLAGLHAGVVATRMQPSEPIPLNPWGGYVAFVVLVLSIGQLERQQVREHVLDMRPYPWTAGRPTIEFGDCIVVTKLSSRDRNPQHGDLIAYGPDASITWVTRVLAAEGQTVHVDPSGPWQVPPGHVLAIDYSWFDSIRLIPLDTIAGRVRAVWWPPEHRSSLDP